jgi:hypothetical protein
MMKGLASRPSGFSTSDAFCTSKPFFSFTVIGRTKVGELRTAAFFIQRPCDNKKTLSHQNKKLGGSYHGGKYCGF